VLACDALIFVHIVLTSPLTEDLIPSVEAQSGLRRAVDRPLSRPTSLGGVRSVGLGLDCFPFLLRVSYVIDRLWLIIDTTNCNGENLVHIAVCSCTRG